MSRFRQAALCATVLMTIATLAAAAPPAVHKTTMEDQPFPAPYHTITVRTVIAAGGDVAPHTHPGLEMAYIVSGRAAFSLAGQAPLMLRAGDTVAVPEGRVHSVHKCRPQRADHPLHLRGQGGRTDRLAVAGHRALTASYARPAIQPSRMAQPPPRRC
ncbi:MAG TPA: cupin domain-containing protein [Caulobacteraceae bacterium]|nr:cupin domain-containing protein [Caulobacteraceae bacterium]